MSDEKSKFNLPELEKKILKFWQEHNIFEKTLASRARGKPFIFYEGPPTANGMPHIGHALTRAFKDVILRYKTMRGFYVPRKAGWDTHGLPVEIEVEKELGFKTKRDIEKYGIDRFNRKAKESVWKYKDEWEKVTRRLGFWLDMKDPYITYQTTYMESLWWIIKEIWKRGLLKEDFKVVPWCTRCGTGLSSHELGLGYKKVKDASIYVKFKIKGKKNQFLLVWTTTPWTLPANVAIAVNPKIEYTRYVVDGEEMWSARPVPYETGQHVSVAEKVSGRSLIGIEYEPLYRVPEEYASGARAPHKVFPADFVSSEEGSGFVHIAPAFGEDDMRLAKSVMRTKSAPRNTNDIDYPLMQTVNQDGTMKRRVIGGGKFVKDADAIIIEDLKGRKLLQKIESYEHDYPFCWRCATPLLYFAKNSWWILVSRLKKELVANNEKINWIPKRLKGGRFGEFIKDVRDWAFSRERYWGTPLPVWRCGRCGLDEVIGSRQELAEKLGSSKNRYFLMRHGESLTNLNHIISYAVDGAFRLTALGKMQAERAAQKLKHAGIDIVFASDILRTKETAHIVSRILSVQEVCVDARLREINMGIFEGKHPREYSMYFRSRLEKFFKRPPHGETLTELRRRIMDFFEDLEKKYSGKTILLVSHEYPLWMLYAGAGGLTNEEAVAFKEQQPSEDFIGLAGIMELPYRRLPCDENKEVNLHRPYIDAVSWECKKCGGIMNRVPEVVDVWFDSGAMPFASVHYPFALAQNQKQNFKNQKLLYPADFICEAIDQTRGWFYTLLAVATLLGKGTPYRNVISLGHVLDKNGQKMSKSKGNVVRPEDIIEKYGADALRWFFYTVNAPGEAKQFDENGVFQKLRGFLMTFWNCFMLFDTYVQKIKTQKSKVKSKNVLDRWILAKLDVLAHEATRKLDGYDITGAARSIEEFVINDFSQWYLRRSRKRFQNPATSGEKDDVAATTAHVLLALTAYIAPFAPFFAEALWQELQRKGAVSDESVHLANWPAQAARIKNYELRIIKDMETVRRIATEALKLRAEAGIKVRQPLRELRIKNKELRNKQELLGLIKDEVNVKEIVVGDELKLDTTMTPELREEGFVREFVRNVQEMRRDLGLKPKDWIRCQVSGDAEIESVLERWKKTIQDSVHAKALVIGGKKVFRVERELSHEGKEFWVGIG